MEISKIIYKLKRNYLYKKLFIPKYPVLVFHHIPKSGGTTVINALKSWHTVIGDYRHTFDDYNTYLSNRININELNRNICLAGHFEFKENSIPVRYPEIYNQPDKYKIFTIFREPLELAVSLYFYEIKTGNRNAEDQSLDDFLKKVNNYTAARLLCNENNYINVIDRYFFIGINEHLQESIDKLAEILKKPKIRLNKINTSPRDDQYKKLSEKTISIFKNNNELDYLIYNYALKKFKSL